jgi:hypothetical protein
LLPEDQLSSTFPEIYPMGIFAMRCPLGFPVLRSNSFSETLERRAAEMERHYRHGYLELMVGMNQLHDAVDAALAGDDATAGGLLAGGLASLERCNDGLSAIGEELVRTRAELFERGDVDPADPLIARERFFAVIDYEGVYRELEAHGATLPRHVYWDELAARVRDGGARAGLRLLDRHLRELQSDLRTFAGELATMRRLSGRELAVAIHGVARPVAALVVGFTRFLTSFGYFSMLCERASDLLEAELVGGGEEEVRAAAG